MTGRVIAEFSIFSSAMASTTKYLTVLSINESFTIHGDLKHRFAAPEKS